MSKELFVSLTPHETKVAVSEEDQLTEIYFERENEYTLAGSIYKGRVTRVLPGMQSAFVEIGLERDAFLYVSDFFEMEDEQDEFDPVKIGGARPEFRQPDREDQQVQPHLIEPEAEPPQRAGSPIVFEGSFEGPEEPPAAGAAGEAGPAAEREDSAAFRGDGADAVDAVDAGDALSRNRSSRVASRKNNRAKAIATSPTLRRRAISRWSCRANPFPSFPRARRHSLRRCCPENPFPSFRNRSRRRKSRRERRNGWNASAVRSADLTAAADGTAIGAVSGARSPTVRRRDFSPSSCRESPSPSTRG